MIDKYRNDDVAEQPDEPSTSARADLAAALLVTQARRRLQASSHAALRRLDCRCGGGTLWVTGRVPSFYLKQLAQSLLRDLDGLKLLINEIEVN